MTVLDEVKQKRDYAQSRKDAGETGYDPAIDFHNRIITYVEEMEAIIKKSDETLKEQIDLALKNFSDNVCPSPYPELSETVRRYARITDIYPGIETEEEIVERVVGVHKSHESFDPAAR